MRSWHLVGFEPIWKTPFSIPWWGTQSGRQPSGSRVQEALWVWSDPHCESRAEELNAELCPPLLFLPLLPVSLLHWTPFVSEPVCWCSVRVTSASLPQPRAWFAFVGALFIATEDLVVVLPASGFLKNTQHFQLLRLCSATWYLRFTVCHYAHSNICK